MYCLLSAILYYPCNAPHLSSGRSLIIPPGFNESGRSQLATSPPSRLYKRERCGQATPIPQGEGTDGNLTVEGWSMEKILMKSLKSFGGSGKSGVCLPEIVIVMIIVIRFRNYRAGPQISVGYK
jgi:hypothetical protein